MKKHITTILLALIFLAGVALILYPTVSDYLNSMHQSQAISTYAQTVEKLDANQYEEILREAQEYNTSLVTHPNNFKLTDDEKDVYNRMLNLDGKGAMGYIEIPSIQVSLPIYHGTNDSVLQTAIGHLEWTSLPVGGESSHCVLSGHRGLPSAKLFTNLDKLVVGDTFTLRVLDEVLTYEVDQILIVEPKDVDNLQIVEGHDYCTLVTCTPYGVNTHRLLVRGHRIDNPEETHTAFVTADATQIKPVLVAAILAIPVLVLLVIALLIPRKRRSEEDDA
jgi:sortase A